MQQVLLPWGAAQHNKKPPPRRRTRRSKQELRPSQGYAGPGSPALTRRSATCFRTNAGPRRPGSCAQRRSWHSQTSLNTLRGWRFNGNMKPVLPHAYFTIEVDGRPTVVFHADEARRVIEEYAAALREIIKTLRGRFEAAPADMWPAGAGDVARIGPRARDRKDRHCQRLSLELHSERTMIEIAAASIMRPATLIPVARHDIVYAIDHGREPQPKLSVNSLKNSQTFAARQCDRCRSPSAIGSARDMRELRCS
jgi:hypothetical protein